MTDVVERLRKADKFSGLDVGHYWNLCEEAADEIERLRRELDEEWARTAEARELAKRWRDVYEWDAIEDPLPVFNFPWEEKPCL